MRKHSKKRIAFFFTLFYPYTHNKVLYDAYVTSEVEQLTRNFESVVIISMSTDHDGQVPVASNVTVHNLNLDISATDKLSLLKIVWQQFFIAEVTSLNKVYHRPLSLPLLKAITVYAVRADKARAFLESLLKQIDFNSCDVWVYSYWNFEYALAAALLKTRYPLKTAVRTHSLDLYFDRVPENYHPFRRFVYLNSDLFVFISGQGQQYFFSNHHIAPALQSKSIVNRIGTQNPVQAYQPSIDRIVILSNAWIQPLKRIDLLIKALALINDVEIEWIHVGDDYGTGRFPALKQMAEDYLAKKTNLRYEFVGRKTKEELFDMYAQRGINLLINLSTTEGTPVSMMEAISFGVPVIGTQVGGVPEIIHDGVNGFLIPVDVSEKEVADKILYWFRLPLARKKEIAQNARMMWEEKFDADKNSAVLLQKILSL